MGAITQVRALGGVVGLAIATNVLNNHVRSGLPNILSQQQIDALLQTFAVIQTLPDTLQVAVRTVYAEGYNLQMKVMVGFCVAQVVSVIIMYEKKARRVA